MTEPYEKPILTKLNIGAINKFGSQYIKPVRTHIDDIPIKDLTSKFGSPLFVFSERTLRRNYSKMYAAFASRYPNLQFSWSYKTNYLDAICAILHQEGETAEVVSEFEYDKAKQLGIPGSQIIFNGPYKPIPALEKAVSDGAFINIDHFDEINDLEKVASRLNKKIKVGLRINMDTGITPQWSRFGFNLESGQAMDAVKRISLGDKLELTGLHCHIGTYIMSEKAYETETLNMIRFAYQVQDKFEYKIEILDIGGGFPSKARLKGEYLSPETSLPPIDRYAEAVCGALLNNLKPNHFPKLVLETGRALVDESGFLISTVHAVKRLPDGRRGYVMDAGLNSLFTSFWYKHKIEMDQAVQGQPENSVLYGPLCMNIDVIDDAISLPCLPRGAHLIISPVGAYNVTQWMQFINYRPGVVLIGEKGETEYIRAPENMDDVKGRERLPERLRINPNKNGH